VKNALYLPRLLLARTFFIFFEPNLARRSKQAEHRKNTVNNDGICRKTGLSSDKKPTLLLILQFNAGDGKIWFNNDENGFSLFLIKKRICKPLKHTTLMAPLFFGSKALQQAFCTCLL